MVEKRFKKFREINRRKNYFFKKIRFNLAKKIIDKRKKKDFSLAGIKKILFLRDDNKIGDMIVSTPILKSLSQNGYELHVLSGHSNYCVIENNPYVDKVYFYPDKYIDIIKLGLDMRKEKYDLIIDMGEQIPVIYLLFIRLINSNNVIGFNKDKINLYNKNITYLGYDLHITERYKSLMYNINIKDFNMKYDIHIPDSLKTKVHEFYSQLPGETTVVINPFSADEKRDLSKEQLIRIISHLENSYGSINIILIGNPERIKDISYLNNCFLNPFVDFISAVEIIRYSDLVISPDTSIVHVAAAYEKDIIALYGNDKHGEFINNYVWGPGNKNAIQLVQEKANSKISEIPTESILEKIDVFLSSLENKNNH
ncbi:glycosyltransferase family 9 protein [Xenorhabdus sp. KJ12.1]|uniref:glycosyltransferase family 9 protein n=1 Tax=Xenorhabdus sp. KJ12.1 TaxID=1851571 RepID=UPI000C0677B9|nr:glycosyltransferase family 9 protein [Xenorhabdus sp. KJ12.1]PHM69888.1 putative ADP-heptose--lipooligosaccharide heptosyltransferase I [Xenorhabdus sp. KJ12.1]